MINRTMKESMKKRDIDIDSIFQMIIVAVVVVGFIVIVVFISWIAAEPSRVANKLDKMGFHDPYEVVVYKSGDGRFRFDKEGVFYECDFANYNDKLIVTNCAEAPEFKLDEIGASK